MSNKSDFPTVATIIGCNLELNSTDGLLATPLPLGDIGDFPQDPTEIKDPIQKAIMDNICQKVPTKPGAEIIKCEICNADCNGQVSYKVHLSGARHAKRLKEQDMKNLADLSFIRKNEDDKSFTCTICNTALNAVSQIGPHIEGSRHKNKEKSITKVAISTIIHGEASEPGVDATPNVLYCAACNIHVNSSLQLAQHTTSKKHITKVNGSGPKRFAPYTKNRPVEMPRNKEKTVVCNLNGLNYKKQLLKEDFSSRWIASTTPFGSISRNRGPPPDVYHGPDYHQHNTNHYYNELPYMKSGCIDLFQRYRGNRQYW